MSCIVRVRVGDKKGCSEYCHDFLYVLRKRVYVNATDVDHLEDGAGFEVHVTPFELLADFFDGLLKEAVELSLGFGRVGSNALGEADGQA